MEETQTRLKIRGATQLESGRDWSWSPMGVGAELLEVATPPSPLRALSQGLQPSSCAGGRQPSTRHSHRCTSRRGVLSWLRASQTCAPSKLCGTANPERGIAWPGTGGAQWTRTPLPTGAHAPISPGPRAPTAMLGARVAGPQPHPDRQ